MITFSCWRFIVGMLMFINLDKINANELKRHNYATRNITKDFKAINKLYRDDVLKKAQRVYNLTEILSPSSIVYLPPHHIPEVYDQRHPYAPVSIEAPAKSLKKRYYIYSHIKSPGKLNKQSKPESESEMHERKARSVTASVNKRTANKAAADRKMVSKNISMVLENLLKSYENSQLPTHGQGIPTVVKTNILIRSMGPVSELDMDYSMDCYFRQYWRDTRLSFTSAFKSLSLSIKMLERIWRPDTFFINGKFSHIHTITVPNKLLRLSQDGDILYSMRLTIKASCPMELRNFPMDKQSCPLVLGSYAYTTQQLVYQWQDETSVNFDPGMTLSQFHLMSFKQHNSTIKRREGEFSTLQVSFNLQRHTGYFLIQVYVPCTLIVILSWVSFWIHREATSDRVGLGITTVLTLSTISLDARTDLPKVRYATALDWFLFLSFFYCIATLLEFAGVHYFTKSGSGEFMIDDDGWEDIEETEEIGVMLNQALLKESPNKLLGTRRRNSLICPIYNDPTHMFKPISTQSQLSTMERMTQTEPPKKPKWKQIWLCFLGDDKFRRERQKEAANQAVKHVNSVSLIDRTSRVVFPASFFTLNFLYWLFLYYQDHFHWIQQ